MLTKRPLLVAIALLLALGFGLGVARLFTLRYEAGEVYPPYSTLRADPLGAKALYAALDDVPGVEVRRNLQPLKKLQPGQPITLVYLGLDPSSWWTERELQEFDSLVFAGSRVVLAFYPYDRPPGLTESRLQREAARKKKRERVEKEEEKEGPDSDSKKPEDSKASEEKELTKGGLLSFEEVAKRYGFKFAFSPPAKDKAYDRHAFVFEPGTSLETDISWHSALYFDELSPDWKAVYLAETKPVIAERSYGRGSIVLVGDSFPFSNEALRSERHSQLLSRVFSGPPVVIFDEEHHGVTEQSGIVQLALKYRLHGVIATLVLIVVLFVWQNSVPFVPPAQDRRWDEDLVAGRDATQGFDNLLHRALKPSELLDACAEEWRRTFSHSPAAPQVEEVFAEEQARPPKERDALATYRRIAHLLTRR